MIPSGEKTFELQFGDEGATCVVRPQFPFVSEGFRLTASGELELFGEGRRLRFALMREDLAAIRQCDEVTLYEFPAVGDAPMRELIIAKSGSE